MSTTTLSPAHDATDAKIELRRIGYNASKRAHAAQRTAVDHLVGANAAPDPTHGIEIAEEWGKIRREWEALSNVCMHMIDETNGSTTRPMGGAL
jgi:hypothetical protein